MARVIRIPIPKQTGIGQNPLLVAIVVSVLLHSSALFAAARWGDCLCRIGKVVCPKICETKIERIDIQLAKSQPLPKQRQKPVVIPKLENKQPAPAPKAGKVVLPPEVFKKTYVRPAETKLESPSLPKNVVVQSKAPMLATAEIFNRANSLTPGPAGETGLGGTGKATSGPFGTAKEGNGQNTNPPPPTTPTPKEEVKPVVQPEQAPPPQPKHKGLSRPPKVLDWSDPPYPSDARKQGIEGVAILSIRVTEAGRAEEVSIARSSGCDSLDQAAVRHVSRARFEPAMEDGEIIAKTIRFKVHFRLS
jgi:periplasmic protein TonB